MRRLALIALLILVGRSAIAQYSTPLTPLRIARIFKATAPSTTPGDCVYGTSPNVLANDTNVEYACVDDGSSDYYEALASSAIDDTAYNATTWNGDTTHAPSKNAVRDQIEAQNECSEISGCVVGAITAESDPVFKTIDAPSGTDPVADSRTDTLTVTAAGSLTITGDSATDTLAFVVTETDAAHDTCGEISGCVVGALTVETDPGVPLTSLADLGDLCAANQIIKRDGTDTANICATITGGGDALTTDGLDQFAATTSAELAGVLSDETGTEKVVFSRDPIFTAPIFLKDATSGFKARVASALLTSDVDYEFDGVSGTLATYETLALGNDLAYSWDLTTFYIPGNSTATPYGPVALQLQTDQGVPDSYRGFTITRDTDGDIVFTGQSRSDGAQPTKFTFESTYTAANPLVYVAGNVQANTFSGALSGNATTATALAANGSNCTAGSYARGVSASGVAEDCTVAFTAAGVPAAETDAAHDTCGEISGCVPSAITTADLTDANIPNTITIDLAAAATALAANPADCAANTWATMISDVGALTCSAISGGAGITNGTVALADLADMATASLYYRKTGGSGAPEVNSLATLKTDLGLTGTNSGDQTTISGNAGTATALAANGSNCAATEAAIGVTAAGVSEGCWTPSPAPSDTAYDASSWDAVTTIPPTKNAVRDKIETLAPKDSPTFTTTATGVTEAFGDADTSLASTAFVAAVGPTFARVTGSDVTRTAQTLGDVTGLSIALTTGRTYEYEAVLMVTTSAVTTGTQYAVNYSSTASLIEGSLICTLASATPTARVERISALNAASGTCMTTSASTVGSVVIRGIITTTGSGNFTIQHLKVTSGTSTVKIGSYLKVTRIA